MDPSASGHQEILLQHIVHKLNCSQCVHVQAQPGQPLRIIAECFDQFLTSGWVKIFDSSLKELLGEVDLSPGMLASADLLMGAAW